MSSDQNPIRDAIRTAISTHSFADPFSHDFDSQKLRDFIESKVGDNGLKDVDSSNDMQMFEAIEDLNLIYKQLVAEIYNIVDETGLTNEELTFRVLAETNFNFCNAYTTLLQTKAEGTTRVSNIHEVTDTEYTNIFGQKGLVGDAVDVAVDVCNELILLINNQEDVDQPKEPHDESSLIILFRRLFMSANYLVNLKEAFEYVKYEFGTILRTEDTMYFKHEPQYYYLIRLSGKDRQAGHIQENVFYLNDLPAPKLKMPQVGFDSNNTLSLTGETDVPQRNLANLVAHQVAYYHYLENHKFSALYNITIADILKVLCLLQAPFQLIDMDGVVQKTITSQQLNNVPIRVESKKLLQALKRSTGIREQAIQSILSIIASDWDQIVDLWKSPLIRYGKHYYFVLASVAYGHITLLADSVIAKFLAQGSQEKLFAKYLKSAISREWMCKHRVSIANTDGLLADGDNLLVIKLNETCVIVAPCIYRHPINSEDYGDAIKRLLTAAERLNDHKEKVAERLPQLFDEPVTDIVLIVLSIHPLLSGLIVENIPVIDLIALKNYLTIGEYRRSTISFTNTKFNSTTLATYKYYESKVEFGNRFRTFVFQCPLIKEKMRGYKIQSFPISFPGSYPQVARDGVEHIKLSDAIWEDINELDYCLKQIFYYGEELEQKPELNPVFKVTQERIEYLMPAVMNYMALDRTDRAARVELLAVFKNNKVVGMTYLVFGLELLLVKLGECPIRKKKKLERIKVNDEQAEAQMKRFLEMNGVPGGEISLSTWGTKHDFTDSERANLLGFLAIGLSGFYQRRYSEKELDAMMLPLIVYVKLVGDDDLYRADQYSVLVNFVDLLNYSGYYQKARDFSEEILEFSFRNREHPAIGWLVMFKCFLRQNSVYDAAFYGNLFFATATTYGEIEESEAFDGIYSTMLFARQFGHRRMLEATYAALKTFPLSLYDNQKIAISYFNSKIRSIEDFTEKRAEIMEYIKSNLNDIADLGARAVTPWILLLYNIKANAQKGYFPSSEEVDNFLSVLENKVPEKELEYIRALAFPGGASKQVFLDALVRAFETRDFEDFASEIATIEPLADRAFIQSIEPLDLRLLLLTGLVLNDNHLTFRSSQADGLTSRFRLQKGKEIRKSIDCYSDNILSNLKLMDHQLLIWLVEVSNEVFCVKITSKLEVTVDRLDRWDRNRQATWVKEMSKFTFDDKGYFPINEQETRYIEVLSQVNFAKLNLNNEITELLLTTSVSMGDFPANLLEFQLSKTNNLGFHEQRVKDAIAKNANLDFISYHVPVTNVISLEWFSVNGGEVSLGHVDGLTLQAWIPTSDGDFVLAMGYEKLKPIMDKYKGESFVDLVPTKPLSGQINIFMAHGGKGFDGFRAVYSSHDAGQGHAYSQDRRDMERIFGRGEIAILFICSSA